MEMTKIAQRARALYDAQGSKAEVKAAQKAKQFEEAGDNEAAASWHAIRKAICEIRGAPQS